MISSQPRYDRFDTSPSIAGGKRVIPDAKTII